MADQANPQQAPSIQLVCTPQTFRPADATGVRWLDLLEDYPLALEAWRARGRSPTRDEWESWADEGYTYAARLGGGLILSVAAALTWQPPSPTSWELAAVWTREGVRNRGHATAVCSFVTAHILGSGRRATCTTRNPAMVRVAERLGYRRRQA